MKVIRHDEDLSFSRRCEDEATVAELADYEPPDPYAAAIKALREKESRR